MQSHSTKSGVHIFNLGTGNGYSVLDMIKAFEAASGLKIPYRIKDRRPGDIAVCYADPAYTKAQTGWEPSVISADDGRLMALGQQQPKWLR